MHHVLIIISTKQSCETGRDNPWVFLTQNCQRKPTITANKETFLLEKYENVNWHFEGGNLDNKEAFQNGFKRTLLT